MPLYKGWHLKEGALATRPAASGFVSVRKTNTRGGLEISPNAGAGCSDSAEGEAEKRKPLNFSRIQGSLCMLSKWCHHESNEGHKDFQSFALPTELWHHFFRLRCKDRNKNLIIQ